jgi:hypothetical protein
MHRYAAGMHYCITMIAKDKKRQSVRAPKGDDDGSGLNDYQYQVASSPTRRTHQRAPINIFVKKLALLGFDY